MGPSLPQFDAVRVLVVGDVMLDRYWYGDTARISPEAPVPVVRVSGLEERAGGAGNVAANIAALGAAATLVAAVGDDDAAQALEQALQTAGVLASLHAQPGWHTVTKLRVISRHQQMVRLDFESPLPDAAAVALAETAMAKLGGVDVVVLSDYAKGALADPAKLIAAARKQGVPVLVDPKGSDWQRYRGATALTPNRAEFEAVAGACADNATLHRRASDLRAELELDALLITRSDEGMTLVTADGAFDAATAAREVFDVTGAGDTVIAALAVAVGAGSSLVDAARIANAAAGVVVGKLGAAAVSPAELAAALHGERAGERGVCDQAGLLARVAAARAAGERVVMTNGCFDILHPGHVAYLDEARRLGDRLVVAVNDDDSVRRLKGDGRPVNALEHRMAVLAGLAAVDWVVPFSADTPADLVAAVRPDILAKGGDYRPEDVAGGEHAGAVRILPFRDGLSTSAIIAGIRDRD